MQIIPVILCGGSGKRLWPMSRGGFPKQYLALVGQQTLVQQTALRARSVAGAAPPIVITNAEQRFLAAEQLRSADIEASAIVLEPVGRDTAPAVAVAALLALQDCGDALLLAMPSDHVICNTSRFAELTAMAAEVAKEDFLVTFGIEPASPHTGYGYIRRGTPLRDGVYQIDRFVEKPDDATASRFLQEGGYYWNSGMFLFKASAFLDELRQHAPAILRHASEALEASSRDEDFLRLEEASFSASPELSIDYAVMEKTGRAAVVAASDLGWNDIGSWAALSEIAPRDDDGNATLGDVLTEGASNSYIRAEHRMVAAVGVSDLVIVETADAVLVAHLDRTQDVKQIVERLNECHRCESVTHRRVYRPWGSYEGIDHGDRFQVKRIVVKPGSSLSLQMHHHRAEHWVVVRGTARVSNEDKVMLLTENQSTYIPLGARHRLENPGKIPLELIEVQSGSYLGEDDIIRFEDNYGRGA
ncbi:mannose-1-phosphate guanylyltransferase/mannose-6-phosphate isomerase [Cupriavidus sp. AU9028]|uniref:mannose-1-phosphate guanylyltransferase/mannose-6-phosphate isomerase n=1 Tax=Cupriavidus sp. AU9028 TaxID=2871157 RepID=UPI001C97C26A|nr:mannose-1-phosphate guanylyltransferase/mannose-6-phosphate isomerase [Cupriavidus sp. AU9028]MBY4896962.1 mannose-1-phosphate guanylyltransferase/mannose-6-phosphate isomerase [Cupriavidus sp. AU9028]